MAHMCIAHLGTGADTIINHCGKTFPTKSMQTSLAWQQSEHLTMHAFAEGDS
jgi:hypothetical protein